jgi:aminoglycoside 6'-N-acetyltransferase I
MNVRHAVSADLEAWLDLRHALWPDVSHDEHRQEVDEFLQGRAREPLAVLLAEQDSKIVGFAELSIRAHAEGCETDRVAFLEGWFVTPAMRRGGVARALVAAAEQWSLAQGCTEFASDTLADNEVSRAAHRNCGFEEAALIRCFRKVLSKSEFGATGGDRWR